MYCPFCGNKLDGEHKFCYYCGGRLIEPEKPKPNTKMKAICWAFGALLILCGIMPYVMQGSLADYNSYLSRFYAKLPGADAVAAVSALMQFAGLPSVLFYFSSSMLAVFAGLMLLRRELKATLALIACAAFNLLSIISTFLTNILVCYAPGAIISIYANDDDIIEAGIGLVESDLRFLSYYQDMAFKRIFLSIVAIAISLLFVLLKRKLTDANALQENNISATGGALMILSLSSLSFLRSNVSFLLISKFFGQQATTISSLSHSIFNQYYLDVCIFAAFAVLAIAVLSGKIPAWIVAVPTSFLTLLLGGVGFLAAKPILVEQQFDDSLIMYVLNNLRSITVGAAMILIAFALWMCAISRGKLPIGLQIALPVAIPIVYIILEFFFKALLMWNKRIPFSVIIIALAISLISSIVDCRKKQ